MSPETVLGDGLVFEALLPLAWTAGPPPDDLQLSRLNAENQQLLAADSSLDEAYLHEGLKDQPAALVHELQRLDHKLNILLRLTAELALREFGLPPSREVRFSASGLEWSGDGAPTPGSTGLLMLYVNPSLHQPLKIPARVVDSSHNGAPTAGLQFTGLSESVVDLIEKMIFRRHRRLVAGSRTAAPRPF